MQQFTIELNKATGGIKVGYSEDGMLKEVKIEMVMDEEQALWFWGWVPLTLEGLLQKGKSTKVKVTPVQVDLSFEYFWDHYDYKVGKKSRTEKLWNTMSQTDRSKCLTNIPRYKFFLAAKNNMEMVYPETFLSQRRWENEFKVR